MTNALLIIVGCCLVSCLIGSLPFGLWVGLLWKGVDIRSLGSKNIGATNVLRVLGVGPGFTVFVLDTVKGLAGIVLTREIYSRFGAYFLHLPPPEPGVTVVRLITAPFGILVLVGLCAILGHSFSFFLRFRGGKGVATSLGVLFGLNWIVACIALGIWIIITALTRYVSLASILAAMSLPVTAAVMLTGDVRCWMVGTGAAIAILVIVKHRANIKRLLAGTESKIGQRVEAAPAEVKETQ